MAKSLVLGALLGGLVAFAWSTVSWMMLPWHETTMLNFQDEDAVVRAIVDNAPASGVYFAPGGAGKGLTREQADAANQAAMEKMKQGPIVFATVQRRGMASMAGPMVAQFLILAVAALLVTWLVLKTRGLDYWGKVQFVTVASLAAGVVRDLPNWNWWGFSTGYTLVQIADVVVTGFIAGLVIARVARTP